MVNFSRILIVWLLASLLASLPAYAQKNKLAKVWVQAVTKTPPQIVKPNLALDRAILNAPKHVADIRLSVARLDHSLLLNAPAAMRPHSTAFLFTTTYKGKKEIWAVTAGHTAQLGEKLRLTFYNGKEIIPVDGTLVQQGPELLSDAALIKLEEPLPAGLRPFELSTQIDPQEKLTTWGYASNKLYQVNNLTFEKDNTRFLRTDFPSLQTKRMGLCGGPLLNTQGQAIGIHCGSTLENKSYAASVRIIPYLLQAYYEGNAQIPIVAKDIYFGSINLNERIIYIQCMNEQKELINQEDIYDQLPQSLIMTLYQDPEVRYLRFLLGTYRYDLPIYRVLVYDKKTQTSYFETLSRGQNIYK